MLSGRTGFNGIARISFPKGKSQMLSKLIDKKLKRKKDIL
jgi:hypothetical protein